MADKVIFTGFAMQNAPVLCRLRRVHHRVSSRPGPAAPEAMASGKPVAHQLSSGGRTVRPNENGFLFEEDPSHAQRP